MFTLLLLKFYSGEASSLPGLNTDRPVAVTFHCILQKILWEWDKRSHMYMRFEGKALGNWEVDVGNFSEHRCVICCMTKLALTCILTGKWMKVSLR